MGRCHKIEDEKNSILDTTQLPLFHQELVKQNKVQVLVEIDTWDGIFELKFRMIDGKDLVPDQTYKYVFGIDPISIERDDVKKVMKLTQTIVLNVVRGFMPRFWQGTSKMDKVTKKIHSAQKFNGRHDTLQNFKSIHPILYESELKNIKYYLFTHGDISWKDIEEHRQHNKQQQKLSFPKDKQCR